MKHGIKKVKFVKGQDAHQALMRKLLLNFIKHGQIETTLSRGKALKARIDRLMNKARTATEADKNVLLKHTASKKVVLQMIELAKHFDISSGFVTMKKFGARQGDAAEVVRMKWVKDIAPKVEETVKPAKVEVVKKAPAKKAPVKKA